MTYYDCITIAAQQAGYDDTPVELLPLTISNSAAMLGKLESDRIGAPAWD